MSPAETMWLNITNFGLGVVTFVCIAAVAWGVLSEVFAKSRARAAAALDDHAFAMPGLGLTMADGGEKVEEKKPETKK